MITKDEQKVLAATTAVDTLIKEGKIFSGMKIGLGTGSTAMPAVKRLAERIADGTLKDVKAVVTSFQTQLACEGFGIPVYTLNDKCIGGHLDLSIDGADEIDQKNNLIKGGGAAHLREKLVEYNSSFLAIVADSSKDVQSLGTKFPLPVEVISDARVPVIKELEKLGASCVLREGVKKAGPVITDNGNMILDCTWKAPVDPAEMEEKINKITGVVECGFFTKIHPVAFIAREDGTVTVR
ncbi:MAG: ribose-5-phosphate isomerase RpiA [Treponema sp.]|nr:ribose-5-phosphate isomerase RpiA [Spirochaetia bacterium]MDD7580271.1 ribose-5-phosphate isomerase RpiA [Treponema sp.]MCI7440404.1 ribose-5-phosphate isomerase RpiA [Spirochaetia bacterium]MDY3758848.1 ribose-5-phosphate isomerase RpiA [Treponema sp.]MDY4131229.1 ribose-5-phosphate isomerase RpiA [Treponema sp.]